MKHTYNITGMTCAGCQAKVHSLLARIKGVKNLSVDLTKGQAEIEMDEHIPTESLKEALKDHPKYQLSEVNSSITMEVLEDSENRSWLEIYKPILLIFGYITVIALIAGNTGIGFNVMTAMRVFMSGFFFTFSFFKFLDLTGFADSYATYDIIAKKFRVWGYLYAFIELALGFAYAVNFQPIITNLVTFIVMTISIIGVLQSVLNKRKIRCACLGAVFNLPMSTITIIEDALMIAMSGMMLLIY